MKLVGYLFALSIVISGCGAAPPVEFITESGEMEYQPYLEAGNSSIIGQAFMEQKGGMW